MSGPTGCSPHCLGTETMSGTRPPLSGTAGLALGPLKPWIGGEGTLTGQPQTPHRPPCAKDIIQWECCPHSDPTWEGYTRGQNQETGPHWDPRGQTSPRWDLRGQTSHHWDSRADQPPLGPQGKPAPTGTPCSYPLITPQSSYICPLSSCRRHFDLFVLHTDTHARIISHVLCLCTKLDAHT